MPSYTTSESSGSKLDVPLKHAIAHSGSIDIVVDATGLKVYGEGEWKVRQHGVSKRRTWKKLHVGVDPLSCSMCAHLLTGKNVTDDHALTPLRRQIKIRLSAA